MPCPLFSRLLVLSYFVRSFLGELSCLGRASLHSSLAAAASHMAQVVSSAMQRCISYSKVVCEVFQSQVRALGSTRLLDFPSHASSLSLDQLFAGEAGVKPSPSPSSHAACWCADLVVDDL